MELDDLRIAGCNTEYYGGDQAWFGFTVGQYGGCGTVAAANITAYLAIRHTVLQNLYRESRLDQACFLKHMNILYEWVRPWKIPFIPKNHPMWKGFGWTFGVWPMGKFMRGIKRFARECGVELKLSNISARRPLEELTAFIRESLGRDCPVAMLIGRKPRYERETVTRPDGSCWIQPRFSLHWVVIMELAERDNRAMVKVMTWGGYSWLDLEIWHRAGGLVPGLVSVTWKE